MNHVARMEVVDALNDVGQLVAGVSVGNATRETLTSPSRSASECSSMYFGRSPPDIQLEMSWSRGRQIDTQEGHDVWVVQVFPHDSFPAECL
jgi:hypothetical protein